MQRKYECMLIVKPDLPDPQKQEIFDKIIKKIESLEGKIIDAKIWDKERNFYYTLKGKGAGRSKYHKGCYWLVSFYSAAENLNQVKETIRLEERILRSLIVNKEKQASSAAA